jgi:hypothetical protein
MKQDQKAELLKIGASLEKGADHKIVVKAPSGDPMFFRAIGLQVITCESEELDTGGSCVLVINAQAALLSGVIIRCLRVLGLEAGRERAKKVVKEMTERLFTILRETGDPRMIEDGKYFETPPLAGPLPNQGQKRLPGGQPVKKAKKK